ncbi:hypothetical protein C0J52_11308 [Blattella germanica]|nr:hypothetical protein C0J52_11308 [Blattella germanica]
MAVSSFKCRTFSSSFFQKLKFKDFKVFVTLVNTHSIIVAVPTGTYSYAFICQGLLPFPSSQHIALVIHKW